MKKTRLLTAALLCFFAMGALDLVGLATNYFKADMALSNSQAGFIPGLVSVWFLLVSIPAGRMMHFLGKRVTVLSALLIICPSLIIAFFCKAYWSMLAAMAMMGVGCTILVVSLNPLVASLVSGQHLASTLTAGQCAKAIAALAAPAIAALGVRYIAPEGGWRIVFAVFLVMSLLAALLLSLSGQSDSETTDSGTSPTSLSQCLASLRKPAILAAFIAVLCHVGSDVGITVVLPQIFQKRLVLPIQDATLSVTVYYVARLAGAMAGILILRKISIKSGLITGVILLFAGLVLAGLAQSYWSLYLAVALLGFGNANICALIISRALLAVPEEQNTTSAVLTMGFAGGALFPLLMGFATDSFGIPGAIAVIAICIAGVLVYSLNLKSNKEQI